MVASSTVGSERHSHPVASVYDTYFNLLQDTIHYTLKFNHFKT